MSPVLSLLISNKLNPSDLLLVVCSLRSPIAVSLTELLRVQRKFATIAAAKHQQVVEDLLTDCITEEGSKKPGKTL